MGICRGRQPFVLSIAPASEKQALRANARGMLPCRANEASGNQRSQFVDSCGCVLLVKNQDVASGMVFEFIGQYSHLFDVLEDSCHGRT